MAHGTLANNGVPLETEPLLECATTKNNYDSIEFEEEVRTKTQRLAVTFCILVTEMCERLTYYSIIAGLVLFCTSNLDIGQTDATTINQVFSGFVYLIPIAGGFIADSFAGRFKTILVSCLIYLIGLVLVPCAAIDFSEWNLSALDTDGKTAVFMCGLVFVALGTGGIKANVGPFGAEQVEPLGADAVQSFFNWFYWVINIGALVAYAGVSYIQQEISFAWGFFVPLASMLIAVFIFVMVKTYYIKTKPRGSILTVAFAILKEGSKSQLQESPHKQAKTRKSQFLSGAKKSFGGSFDDHIVDGVVSVVKVIPFCLLVIMYWAIYAQMTNTFFAQAERMDIRIGNFNLPAAALNVFNTIIIIILIPVVDRLLYPCFEKLGSPLTFLKRIGIGMVIAAMSVTVAGVVEIYRKEELFKPNGSHVQVLADENFTASSMSVFAQVPQFALIGASEIFTSISSLEFAYNQAPVAMQGLLTGLFLAASGIGNWVSMAILAIVKEATADDPWWGDDINYTKMENLMFLLAGLMGLNFLIFCIVAHNYEYQDPASFEAQEDAGRHRDDGRDNGAPPLGTESRKSVEPSSNTSM